MAAYLELFDLKNHNDLNNKLYVAVVKKAQTLLDGETPSNDEAAWANSALTNPVQMATKILYYLLAANSGMTTAQILGAADSAIQAHVDAAADALITGGITT